MKGLYKTKRDKDDVGESTAITAVRAKSLAQQVDPTVPAYQTVNTRTGDHQLHSHSSKKAEAQ